MEPFGTTRSSIQPYHALITPDTHVISPLLGWKDSSAVIHISPEMGARFTQYTAILGEEAATQQTAGTGVERFVLVQAGEIELSVSGQSSSVLQRGGYFWLPPDTPHEIAAHTQSRLVVFEKTYEPLPNRLPPNLVVAHESDMPAEPFQGDPDALLQTLLPTEPGFDMAVNLFTYQPGATLPQVEVHVMEHGLLMLEGAGVYRLGDRWYPVQSGDVIWMAPYCPQWFVAMGKTPARYVYYKDIHRAVPAAMSPAD